MNTPLISAKQLSVEFPLPYNILMGKPKKLKAVNNVNIDIPAGSFFGLVGESGSGKTTLGKALLRAVHITSGEVRYNDGESLYHLNKIKRKELKEYRKKAQLIFQDPYTALSPRLTVRDIIAEPAEVMQLTGSKEETDRKVKEIAQKCRLNIEHLRRFPHAFSGGQRQRISIARALISSPKFIVADESVAALDLSIQADIINLLKQLQREFGFTFLFISHDISVIAYACDRVAVMYLGELVEVIPSRNMFQKARHPYTKVLLSSVPSLDPAKREEEALNISGEIPSPADPPSGCKFHTRCPFAREKCRMEVPELRQIDENHRVSCHYAEELFEL